MFGMLDYRAHKLYKLIFIAPSLILYFIGLVLIPAASLLVAVEYAEGALTFALYAIASLLILEIIFQIIGFYIIIGFFNAVFYYLVDVVPTNGRNKEQAEYIAKWGRYGELDLKFSEYPKNWLDDEIEEFGERDWVQRVFFSGRTKRRMYAVREYYSNNEEEVYGATSIDSFLSRNGMYAGLWERLCVNRMYRIIMLRYLIVLVGIVYVLSNGDLY